MTQRLRDTKPGLNDPTINWAQQPDKTKTYDRAHRPNKRQCNWAHWPDKINLKTTKLQNYFTTSGTDPFTITRMLGGFNQKRCIA